MSKFRKGETSSAVIEIKNSITNSIKRKSKLIDKISTYDDIPSSLTMKSKFISIMSVHSWVDEELEIISYTYNTAKSEHNKRELENLKESIRRANNRLSNNSNSLNSTVESESFNKLRIENEQLYTALAEVYRAYMQLLGEYREDKYVDSAFREMILNQAKVLGKKRIWEVN